MEEVWEISTHAIIKLQELEEAVDESVYVTQEPFVIDQVRERVDSLQTISEIVSKLDNRIRDLTKKFLDPVVVSASLDGSIRVWKFGEAKVLEDNTEGINSLAVCRGVLASGSNDYAVRLWSLATGEVTQRLYGHSG